MSELFNLKSPEVVEYIKEINAVRKVDNKRHLDLACDLFDMAQEQGDDLLKDFASCTLGDASCQNNDFSQALYYLSAGIDGLSQTEEHMLVCQSYNEMGTIFRSEGHFITSEECYLTGISRARKYKLYFMEGMICSNFAALCEQMGGMVESLEYHYRAVECCGYIEDPYIKNTFLIGEYSLIAKQFVELEKFEEARETLRDMEMLIRLYPEFDSAFDVCIARFYYYHDAGDRKKSDESKIACIQAFYQCNDFVRHFDEIVGLVSLLLEDKDYVELEKIFERIDGVDDYEDIMNLRLHMETFKIKMYREIGDFEKMKDSAYNYFLFDSIKAEEGRHSFITTLNLRSQIQLKE
ncbi:hypothetical protein SAMN02910384_02301 [Pseudobutyrivibrio sp. ACV-2]|uniref:hypothetical protein n=1 Tax=Pseudobutyrivibrio sp. ACV-2 TaxID=1520801 RepID=UPI00089D0669|nr:hypothetical protein [Pseudobutyrivibrio sp. ACV-2]SEA77211.1 hypothetical protein SAMN02910384_02301 [Pseudobutyrivibrio sp. ACV-2]